MRMKASVMTGKRHSELVELDIPSIGDEEVLIRVKACGVCASELHPWLEASGRRLFGHEPVGIVEAVGPRVTGFQEGDRVTGLIHQAFAQFTKADYRSIVRVPDGLDDLEALGEPLSCLMSGADRTPVSLGDDVALVGAGFMGLGFLQLMKLKGAGRIVGVDPREESLGHAMRFGAEEVCTPDNMKPEYKVTEWKHMEQGIPGVRVAVEASGTESGLQLAGNMAAVHGTLSVVGYHQGGMRSAVHLRQMEAGLKLIAAGHFNMRDLITHEFRLDEVDQAYEAIRSKPPGFIKSVIRLD